MTTTSKKKTTTRKATTTKKTATKTVTKKPVAKKSVAKKKSVDKPVSQPISYVYFKVTWNHGFVHQYPVVNTKTSIENEETFLSRLSNVEKYEYQEKKWTRVKGL
jgi:hypothetical protein